MIDYKKIIKSRELRLKLSQFLLFIPDSIYLKIVFRIKTGKKLNLKNPQTFCDKLNWLKINDIHPEYSELADKIRVREHVKKVLGEDICIPLLGSWKHYDDINFDDLPERFVLKCNHDSGSVKIIQDKSTMDHKSLRKFFEDRLKENSYADSREYPYRYIKPRIMAEKYVVDEGKTDLDDYKFFCFNGEPVLLYVATERSENCKFDFFDMKFNHLDITNIHPQSNKNIPEPQSFGEMKKIAQLLSKGYKFVRIDLYEISGKVYLGEYTFFHAGGMWPLTPEEWEIGLGQLIKIN